MKHPLQSPLASRAPNIYRGSIEHCIERQTGELIVDLYAGPVWAKGQLPGPWFFNFGQILGDPQSSPSKELGFNQLPDLLARSRGRVL
ncbi:MAG: hypothetical protein OXM02_03815 [Bacteroidota bacterium]|nr:hypothetical protein [Bacteroidota bacterium]MDE2833626.1 hypothetical protein [Bacteroidota bacterium]